MSKSETAKDKQNLINNALAGFDEAVTVEEVLDSNSNTANERKKSDPERKKLSFKKLLKSLADEKLKDKCINNALNSVGSVAATEFEKKLMKENSSIQASSLQNRVPDPMIKSICEGSSKFQNKYINEFEQLDSIGRGGFGTVWKAKHKIDDIVYAVKRIKFKYKSNADYKKVIREVISFATLNHVNVVGYNQAWFEEAYSSASRSSTEEETSNSSSPSKENSELYTHQYSKEHKSDNSKRYPFSEKSIEFISFRDSVSDGSFSSVSRKTTKLAHFDLPSKDNSSTSSNTTSESNSSDSNCNISKTKSKSCSAESVSRSSKPSIANVFLYIQMEYCDDILEYWLDERAKGNSSAFQLTVVDVFRDILKGVAHIHSKSIIHRDLKPQNIFFSAASNTMKIGDFGLATLSNSLQQNGEISMDHSSGCGTIPYSAPEQRSKRKYDSKVDMYSLGIILIELLIDAETRMEFSNAITKILNNETPEKLSNGWPEYVKLVKSLVQLDPKLRPSAKEALSQPPILSNVEVEQRIEIKDLKEVLAKKEMELCEKDKEINEKDKQIKDLKTLLEQFSWQDKYN